MLIERENAKGSWEGLKQSLAHDASLGEASEWVNNTVRLVRPGITFLLWVMVWFFYRSPQTSVQSQEIASGALFAAMTATLWWFGDRARNG